MEQQHPRLRITPSRESYSDNGVLFNESHGHNGMTWPRVFGSGDPYASIKWERRDARIIKSDGSVVFEQKDVEVPHFWSQTATDIVASKYFRGKVDSPEREWSAKQMIDRVAMTIAAWGWEDGYFAAKQDFENFRDDLRFILINQYAAFNSPVWFNVGVAEKPQCSACFILSIEDNMNSILEWYRQEGMIFKGGSGSGVNLSVLRSSKEPLSHGGYSSGPVSFMKGADGVANSIKSGGATRRAAKMVVLNADHPDIKSFIYCKKEIEDMTKALERAGIKASIEGDLFDPYTLLPFQNANNSVRVTDDFMKSVVDGKDWELKSVTTGETIERLPAREIMEWIADATWHSADPGMQYDTTINDWHTCPVSGRINASNPCSEYMHLDDSACNLASLNLLKFLREDGSFDMELYRKVIDNIITAQEIVVDRSSYPTEKIGKNASAYRELGMGYANLGALLMTMGLPYDSEAGRMTAGALTSFITGEAYAQSARIAKIKGPFDGFAQNAEPMIRVLHKHSQSADNLVASAKEQGLIMDEALFAEASKVWLDAVELGERYGVRNSQATVLAPTGTIAFLMDCITTGIEPELALIKYKKLVGGGTLKLVNSQVGAALNKLGYNESEIREITNYVLENETIEGAPALKEEHLPVFDCSFKALNGARTISYLGHLKMMGAVQPFVSGAISKTVNLPADATKEDIYNAYIEAWKLGIKAVAFYRDGSKTVQPLNTSDTDKVAVKGGYRRMRLPDERTSITHKFSVAGHEGYLTVGLYPDSKMPGETFVTIAKQGSTASGLLDTIATLISVSLQSGVPLKTLVKKFKDVRFEPAGMTSNKDIPFAKSIIDYIFRYLGMRFLPPEDREDIFGANHNDSDVLAPPHSVEAMSSSDANGETVLTVAESDAPICECGGIMNRAGACYTCPNCFASTGVCG